MSAVHELYLQPEYFELAPDLNRPSAKLGAVADYLYPKFLKYKKVSKQDILEASDIINYYKGKITDDSEKKEKDDEIERYKEITEILDDLNNELDEIGKLKDEAWGPNKLNAMD